MTDMGRLDGDIPVADEDTGTLTGRPRRGAARRAVESIKDLVGSKPSIQYAPEEIAARRAVRDIRAQVKADYEALQNNAGRRGKKLKIEDLPLEVQALRSCSELVSVSHFLTIFGKKFGIKPATPDILEAEYQVADSLIVNDMNARLLRKLLDRDDIIFSNWMEHFRTAYAEYEAEEETDDESEEEEEENEDDLKDSEDDEQEEKTTTGTITVAGEDGLTQGVGRGNSAGMGDEISVAEINGCEVQEEQKRDARKGNNGHESSPNTHATASSSVDTVDDTKRINTDRWVRRTRRRSSSTRSEVIAPVPSSNVDDTQWVRRTRRQSSSSATSTCPATPLTEVEAPKSAAESIVKMSVTKDTDSDEAPFVRDYADLTVVQRVSTTYLIQCWLVGEPVLREVIDNETNSYDLRAEPIGKDAKNVVYYDFGDFRLYGETQATKTKESMWQTVCVTATEWADFVRGLKRTSNREEKKLYAYLDSVLPNVLAELQRRDIEELKKTLGDDVLLRASSRVRKNAAKAVEDSKRKYMEEEEQRLKSILRQKSDSNDSDETSSGDDSDESESDAASESRRSRNADKDKQLREMRRIQRDNEIMKQKEEEEAKKKHADAVRAYRMAVREARKRGLAPPEMPAELRTEDTSVSTAVVSASTPAPKKKADKQMDESVVVSSTPPMDRNARARLARKISTPESKLKMFDFERFVGWYYGKRIMQLKTGKRFFSSSMANAAAESLYNERTVKTLSEWHVYMDDARKVEQKSRAKRAARERRLRKRARERSGDTSPDSTPLATPTEPTPTPTAHAKVVRSSTQVAVVGGATCTVASTEVYITGNGAVDNSVLGDDSTHKRKFDLETATATVEECGSAHRDKRFAPNGNTEVVVDGGSAALVPSSTSTGGVSDTVQTVESVMVSAVARHEPHTSPRIPVGTSPPKPGMSLGTKRRQFIHEHGLLATPNSAQQQNAALHANGHAPAGREGAPFSTPVNGVGSNENGMPTEEGVRQLTPLPVKPGTTPFFFNPGTIAGHARGMSHLDVLEE